MKLLFLHPLVTEKSMAATSQGVYQFIVPTWATKRQIAELVARHFNVTVETVKTATMRGKLMTFRRKPGQQTNVKKASVHLKKGETIADFSLPVEEQAQAPASAITPINEKKPKEAKTTSQITVRSKKQAKQGEA